jgi:hypothetical protein
VAAELQQLKGDRNFILDTRAEEWRRWGVSSMTVWRYAEQAEEDGYLELKMLGSYGKKASEYRFVHRQAPALAA